MEVADKVLTCTDCGSEFIFSAGEQTFFQQKGFTNEPKRCRGCKAQRNASGPPRSISGTRVETQVTCAGCGQRTTVPFKPTQGKPVYCRGCFKGNR